MNKAGDKNRVSFRRLSSDWTSVYKFICIPGYILLMGIVTLVFAFSPSLVPREIGRVTLISFLVIIWIVGSVFLFWAYGGLKKVELVGASLRISNYLRTIEIPLFEVEAVSGSLFLSPELIWIRFKHPNEFGYKTVFIGKLRFFGGLTRHPMVRELQELLSRSEAIDG